MEVVADGYQPAILDSIAPNTTSDPVIALQKADAGQALRGWVLNPDGTPANDAQVAMLTLDYSVPLEQAKFRDEGDDLLANTSTSGQFSFPVNPRAYSVAAVSANGFARLRVSDPGMEVTLQLQPWGRIEGTVDEKERAQPIMNIVLMDDAAMNYKGSVMLDINSFSAKVDANGHFTFEKVPPGSFSLYICRGMGIPYSCQTPVTVRPG
jgi:hypothetical protein